MLQIPIKKGKERQAIAYTRYGSEIRVVMQVYNYIFIINVKILLL